MASREELQIKLEELMESKEVHYLAPGSGSTKFKMEYPAIKYSLSNIDKTYANNLAYSMRDRYELIVIAKLPDHPVIKKLLMLPYCSYSRQYKADNLYHDVLSIYY